MKIVRFLGTTTILALSMTTVVRAGGLAGGGGPPSLKILEAILQQHAGRAALFMWDDQTFGLGVDQALVATMILTAQAKDSESIALDTEDFEQVAGKKNPLRAINREGITRSYRVLDGHESGTLILIDRRFLIRSGQR